MMQRFFDQLAYDARPGFRHEQFYSALDKHNYSLVSLPGIQEVDSRRTLHPRQPIGRATRNTARYALYPGEVDIFTSDQALLSKIAVRLHARTYPYVSDDQIFFMASKRICNADDLRMTREAINLYHAGLILPFACPTVNDSTLVSKELLQATQAAAAAPDAWL